MGSGGGQRVESRREATGSRRTDTIRGEQGAPPSSPSEASSSTRAFVFGSAQRKGGRVDGVAAPRGDPTSADSKFADAQAQGGGGEEGRQGSHKDASPSPRYYFQWVEEHLAKTIEEMEKRRTLLMLQTNDYGTLL